MRPLLQAACRNIFTNNYLGFRRSRTIPHAAAGGAPSQRQLLRSRLMAMKSSRAPRPKPPIRARRPFDLELLKASFVTVAMFCLAIELCIARNCLQDSRIIVLAGFPKDPSPDWVAFASAIRQDR
jgi:hypothetical protein